MAPVRHGAVRRGRFRCSDYHPKTFFTTQIHFPVHVRVYIGTKYRRVRPPGFCIVYIFPNLPKYNPQSIRIHSIAPTNCWYTYPHVQVHMVQVYGTKTTKTLPSPFGTGCFLKPTARATRTYPYLRIQIHLRIQNLSEHRQVPSYVVIPAFPSQAALA